MNLEVLAGVFTNIMVSYSYCRNNAYGFIMKVLLRYIPLNPNIDIILNRLL